MERDNVEGVFSRFCISALCCHLTMLHWLILSRSKVVSVKRYFCGKPHEMRKPVKQSAVDKTLFFFFFFLVIPYYRKVLFKVFDCLDAY